MNLTIFHFLNNLTHHSMIFDLIVFIIAGYGDILTITAALIFLAVLIFIDQKKKNPLKSWLAESSIIGLSALTAWVAAYVIKIIAHAPRPFVTFPEIRPLLMETPYDSFPSGHATVFFALATAIYLRNRRAGIFFFLCAFSISIGRVIAGIHYPQDILAGAFLGIAIALLLHLCQGIFFRKSE